LISGTTREEFFGQLGQFRLVDPVIRQAYLEVEKSIMAEDLEGSPHGDVWHTSFHASEFPGDDERACGRYALYSMMNVPQVDEIDDCGRAIMDAGKDAEMQQVRRLYRAGFLISAHPDEDRQTGWMEPQSFLTGNTDGIQVLPFAGTGRILEFKGKDGKVIDEMRLGTKKPDTWHIKQVNAYIGMGNAMGGIEFGRCRESGRCYIQPGPYQPAIFCPIHGYSQHCWELATLGAIEDGTLLYFARERPRTHTHEFHFKLDPRYLEAGRARLRLWMSMLQRGELPHDPAAKRHPFGWMWSIDPCDYCPYKKHVCKPDWKAGITRLEDSHMHEFSRRVSLAYRPDEARLATLRRWELWPPEEDLTHGEEAQDEQQQEQLDGHREEERVLAGS
jgi:hypothetical protein